MTLTIANATHFLASMTRDREIVAVEPIARGMLNTIYSVTLCGDDRPSLVLRERHFSDPEYGQEFAAERFAYTWLPGPRPQRPRLHGVFLSDGAEGHRIALFEYVSGRLLDVVLRDPATPAIEVERLLAQLGEDLAAIHARDAHGFGTLRRVDHAADEALGFWGGLFRAEVRALERFLPQPAGRLALATRSWIDTIAAAPAPLVRPCLVHGDVHGRNLLIREGKIVFIDWEAARFRSAAYDFVQLHAIDLASRPDWASLLRQSYLRARGLSNAEPSLLALVRVFTLFWRVRMAIFMETKEQSGCSYFGRREVHRTFLEAGEFT